ncbi:DUF2490 domain-containing protein [Arachidicoccus rhizosphaerae]|nr:DUF2490 domain-containing protein [Arachidicoccus rhizosphaerae]
MTGILLLAGVQRISAQITPPGLSNTKIISWMAVGLEQSIDSAQNWQSNSFIGYGRMSNPEGSYDLFKKPSIWVLNEEIKRKLSKHFNVTGGLSLRKQYIYEKTAPYHKAASDIKKELMLYGILSYGWSRSPIKWNLDFRPEYRTFYMPEFSSTDTRKAFRARFKLRSMIPLTANREHTLIFYAESLFQNKMTKIKPKDDAGNNTQQPDAINSKNNWSGFGYEDSYFCGFYRYAPAALPFYAEIGYMNNLVGSNPSYTMHHIALDIIFKDIF